MSGSSGPGGHVAAYIPANGASSGHGSAYAVGLDYSSNQRQQLTGPNGALHSNTTSSNHTGGDSCFTGSGPGLSGHNPSGYHMPPGGMQQYAPATLTPTMSIQASNSTAAKMLQSARSPGGLSTDPMRPMLADVPCSCPMICMMQTWPGAARVVPLPTTQLSFRLHCHLGLSFVDLDMLCTFPEVSHLWNPGGDNLPGGANFGQGGDRAGITAQQPACCSACMHVASACAECSRWHKGTTAAPCVWVFCM
jgi:hypothetical protein